MPRYIPCCMLVAVLCRVIGRVMKLAGECHIGTTDIGFHGWVTIQPMDGSGRLSKP